MAARDKVKIGVRWPLKQAIVNLQKDNEKIVKKVKPLIELILKQSNLKGIKFNIVEKILEEEVNGALFKFGHIILDTEMTKELEEEGYYREIMRRIQDLRKKYNLKREDRINLDISFGVNLNNFEKEIKGRAGVKFLSFNGKKLKESINGKIKDRDFELSFEKAF